MQSSGHQIDRDETAIEMGHPKVRGTQSFVGTLSSTWRRPGLTLREIAWRWSVGFPGLVLVVWQVRKALAAATNGTMDPASLGLDRALLNDPVGALTADPMGAAGKFSHAIGLVLPGLEQIAVWLLPLLLVVWIAASSVGRTLVLRRADPGLRARVGTLMALQGVRMAVLVAVFWAWFAAVSWIGRVAINGPVAAGQDPNLILYCALLIVVTLGMYTAWAFVGWVLAVAPLLAMVRDVGPAASLRGALGLGAARGRLAEVSLVMAIVKVALLVLAMTFSATPLPFEDVATPTFLAWWWVGVGMVYVLWSDFFHVARLVAYLSLIREEIDHN